MKLRRFTTPRKTAPADGIITHPALGVAAPTSIAEAVPVTDGEHGKLLHALAAAPDPHDPRGVRYPLTALLAVAVCAVMAGASSFAAITYGLHDLDERAQERLGFTAWTWTRRVTAESAPEPLV